MRNVVAPWHVPILMHEYLVGHLFFFASSRYASTLNRKNARKLHLECLWAVAYDKDNMNNFWVLFATCINTYKSFVAMNKL